MDINELSTLTHQFINPYLINVNDKWLKPLLERFKIENKDNGELLPMHLIDFYEKIILEELNHIHHLNSGYDRFVQLYPREESIVEQQKYILMYAKELGSTESELKKDKAAFSRWFDEGVMHDRYHRRVSHSEGIIIFCLKQLGLLIGSTIKINNESDFHQSWLKLNIEKTVENLFDYKGDSRVLESVFFCLNKSISAIPSSEQKRMLSSSTIQFVYQSALERNINTWTQSEALNLLKKISTESLLPIFKKSFNQIENPDDFFFRGRAAASLLDSIDQEVALTELVPIILKDPSPHVRQTLAKNLYKLPPDFFNAHFSNILYHDDCEQVRASALLSSINVINNQAIFPTILKIISHILQKEGNVFVIRVALKIIIDGYVTLAESFPALANQWVTILTPLLDELHLNANSLSVRRWAAETNENLWCETLPEANEIRKKLSHLVNSLQQGEYVRLPDEIIKKYDINLISRVMSVMAQRDFGLVLFGKSNEFMMRGNLFSFKLWRLIHEIRNPAIDKRQGFSHVIGRDIKGCVRAPSAILCEMSETKVPGEPLFISDEGGYRPYLPLMDDIISALSYPNTDIAIYTSEGVTTLRSPAAFIARFKIKSLLNIKFAYYARLRNWKQNSQFKPNHYIQTLRKLGMSINFKPHEKKAADHSVTRFFAGLGFFPISEQWQYLKDYFFSVFQNSLSDLTYFSLTFVLLFFISRIVTHNKLRKIRRALPLVIGGWGTRGKSGAERLKAALFNALGYSIVSKTTGCEAMFLVAHPYGKLHELFLYRPYDKATIWEQTNVMGYANKFNTDIFLWECMALRPAYVSLMQRQWTQDDISTITNTFPDHEDMQGPAGINIADVIANFIPEGRHLVTSEESMLPILQSTCSTLNTTLYDSNWLNLGLLTPDVLSRFPYTEHPSNIALIVKLGELLGVESDFTLKEMADRVVPDLGVLKVYPTALINQRKIEFINGMSANERYGTLSNWERLQFDKHDPYHEPSIWITALVNNRADRPARSQVFASILVNDISADKYFLIGTNLKGLMSYIEYAWDRYSESISLWPENASDLGGDIENVLTNLARRYRISFSPEQVVSRLQAMLTGIGLTHLTDDLLKLCNSPEVLNSKLLSITSDKISRDIINNHCLNLETLSEFQTLMKEAKSAELNQHAAIDTKLRSILKQWFMRKIYVIEDASSTGNQMIHHIVQITPPGFKNKVMGIQNIKGTGLDFVYCWQSWEKVYRSCEKMQQKKITIVEEGVRELADIKDFNLLCLEHVKNIVAYVQANLNTNKKWLDSEINILLNRIEHASKNIDKEITSQHQTNWKNRIFECIKIIFDSNQSIIRRKKANLIYKDILNGRISFQRAVLELQKLNKSQK